MTWVDWLGVVLVALAVDVIVLVGAGLYVRKAMRSMLKMPAFPVYGASGNFSAGTKVNVTTIAAETNDAPL